MSEQDDIAALVRSVRARVPMDAAQMLVKETPERIGMVFAELPQMLVERIQANLPLELQLQASESLAEVIENTVGQMMDPALAVFPQTTTVQEAISFLRNHETPQQITYLYVTDAEDKLLGLIVIRDLLLAEPNQTLKDVMLPEPFALTTDMDVADAVKAAIYRHYPVYPVVDADRHVIGVVRGWRLFERQAIELSAQSGQMVGVDREERLYTGIWTAFKMRHGWLQVNLLGGLRGQPFPGHHLADRGTRGFLANPCGPKRKHGMPGVGDHASWNHAWRLEQSSRAQVDRKRADAWRDERFADGYHCGVGNVVERRWKRQPSKRAPRPRHPTRHDRCLHGFGSIRCAGAIDAATIRCRSLHRIEHLSHHRNRYRRNGTYAGIGDHARTLGRVRSGG